MSLALLCAERETLLGLALRCRKAPTWIDPAAARVDLARRRRARAAATSPASDGIAGRGDMAPGACPARPAGRREAAAAARTVGDARRRGRRSQRLRAGGGHLGLLRTARRRAMRLSHGAGFTVTRLHQRSGGSDRSRLARSDGNCGGRRPGRGAGRNGGRGDGAQRALATARHLADLGAASFGVGDLRPGCATSDGVGSLGHHRHGASAPRPCDDIRSISCRMRASRLPARAAAEHHGDDVAVAAVHRGDQIEARGADVAGLDAVDAFDAAEQMIVVARSPCRESGTRGVEKYR